MPFKHPIVSSELQETLGRIYDSICGSDRKRQSAAYYKRRRFDFVFHMTDWLRDLEGLKELYDHPEKADIKEARTFIIGFLIHVVPHVSTAGRILLDEIADPFAEDYAKRKKPTRSLKRSPER